MNPIAERILARMSGPPRWHTVPGLVARRDRSVPLILEVEQCEATHPDYGRCAGIRNHTATGPLSWQHGNPSGGWS